MSNQTTNPWRRITTGVVGVLAAANGLRMITGPQSWYETVPGVTETGPFNPHFVLDVGFAFVVAGIALLLFAWRKKWWPAGVAGSAFLGLHGLLHLYMIVMGHTSTVALELGLVVIPAAVAAVAVGTEKGAFDA